MNTILFQNLESANLEELLLRCSGSRVVLLGESTHGTSEFYRMRARLTQELIARFGFNCFGIEADWTDGAEVNRYLQNKPIQRTPFTRFPQWMWRNREFFTLLDALRAPGGVYFFGIDLYCLERSIEAIFAHLQKQPTRLASAQRAYRDLYRFASHYGPAVQAGQCASCQEEALRLYQETTPDDDFDLVQNLRLVARAEVSYRALSDAHSPDHWNTRDSHMFETIEAVLAQQGPASKAIIWAHNSHIGYAPATQMPQGGLFNFGQLCRERYPTQSTLIGFGFYRGAVVSAPAWGAPGEIRSVAPAHEGSYEAALHQVGSPGLLLPLRGESLPPRLLRGIGSVYPHTQPDAYQQVTLSSQFDEYLFFDETSPLSPL